MSKYWIGLLLVSSGSLHALSFEHQDWEMACDNTHTCRIAGYQAHDDAPVSILLTYPAGHAAKISGKVRMPDAPVQATLWINAKPYGVLNFKHDQAHLTQVQIQALLAHTRQNMRIELRQGGQIWPISDRGLSAVLLKSDEYQRRVGTASALLAKGKQPLSQVRAMQAMPKYRINHYVPAQAQHVALNEAQAQKIVARLKKSTLQDDCPLLWKHEDGAKLTMYPLNAQQVLVQVPCWQAAYNTGLGMWLMNQQLSEVQQGVTYSGTSFSEGQVFAQHKGRGLGDCYRVEEWAFTGQRFRKTYQAAHLQCKGFVGGAWQLPTWVSQVTS